MDQILHFNPSSEVVDAYKASLEELTSNGFVSMIKGEVKANRSHTSAELVNVADTGKFLLHEKLEKQHSVVVPDFDINWMPLINWDEVCGGHRWEKDTKLILESDWYSAQASDSWLWDTLVSYLDTNVNSPRGMEYDSRIVKAHDVAGRMLFPRYSSVLNTVVYDFARLPTEELHMWVFNTSQFTCLGRPEIRDPLNECAAEINKFLMPIVDDVGMLVCDYDSFTVTQMGFLIAGITLLCIGLLAFCCVSKKRNTQMNSRNVKHKMNITGRPRTRYSDHSKYGRKTGDVIILKKNGQNTTNNDTVYAPADDVSMNNLAIRQKHTKKKKKKRSKAKAQTSESSSSQRLVRTNARNESSHEMV